MVIQGLIERPNPAAKSQRGGAMAWVLLLQLLLVVFMQPCKLAVQVLGHRQVL